MESVCFHASRETGAVFELNDLINYSLFYILHVCLLVIFYVVPLNYTLLDLLSIMHVVAVFPRTMFFLFTVNSSINAQEAREIACFVLPPALSFIH